MIKNRVDLKGLSKDLSLDINQNIEWLNIEISYVIDGSYDSEELNKDIIELYDITKINRGRRNNNLLAKIGLHFIKQYSGVDFNQALKIYNYLSNEDKEVYRDICLGNLDYYMENIDNVEFRMEPSEKDFNKSIALNIDDFDDFDDLILEIENIEDENTQKKVEAYCKNKNKG